MHGTKLIHKLFTKRQNMRPTFMGRTFAADGMSGNGYFAALPMGALVEIDAVAAK